MDALRTVDISRYITPLREGGSLPAIVEADDGFLYVLKFRGAGQGIKALVAELIGGAVARVLGFRVPEIVLAQVDPAFGRTEPDEEIQDLLKASGGLNLALHYLSGAISFDPVVNHVDVQTASRIVWMDALLTNVDRTARNTNMLVWRKELWMIDHGASLYFHHAGNDWERASSTVFPQVKDHVLLQGASEIEEADDYGRSILTENLIRKIVAQVPGEWLPPDLSLEAGREVYKNFLISRIRQSNVFINQIQDARKALI